MDTEGEGLCGENDLDQPVGEQLFDDGAEKRKQARVMSRDPRGESRSEGGVVQRLQVGGWNLANRFVGESGDIARFYFCRETEPATAHLLDGTIATRAGENKVDGGEEFLVVQRLDGVEALGPQWTTLRRHASIVVALSAAAAFTEKSVGDRHHFTFPKKEMPQRNGAVSAADHGGVAAHAGKPVPEFVRIGDRGRQADELNVGAEGEDDLLPHDTTRPIAQIMDLVHHDTREGLEKLRLRVDHVAEHLGRHDNDVGVGIDRMVPGEETDGIRAESRAKLPELLVAQRFDRRCVDARASAGERTVRGVLADEGFSRPRRSGHEHVPLVVERVERLLLERVRPDVRGGEERGQQRARLERVRALGGAVG